MSRNFPVPDLVDIAEVQLELPTGWRDISSSTMENTHVSATPDKLNNSTVFGSKHVSHFYTAIGEGSTKCQEKLFETLRTTKDHTRGHINNFAILGSILSGIVEPVRIRLVSIVGIIPSQNESHNLLCSHRNILSR